MALKHEIKAIEDFLSIQKSRFDTNYNVIYFCNIKKDDYEIPPMTILSIIENIFKYGVINNIANPIKIFISLKDNIFRFESTIVLPIFWTTIKELNLMENYENGKKKILA